jgi:hypothetical protein
MPDVQSELAELTRQSATYILGLEKQIERLKADHDTGAIFLIEEEITLEHFK